MVKKLSAWKTKGMNRDLSVSAFNPEFAFENRNLRLSTNEGNTQMSWVNEKGTAEISLDNPIEGTPIGTAIINHQLVLFTSDNENEKGSGNDRIYKLKYNSTKTSMECTLLYNKSLNFCILNPIETLVSYESESVQKVYWVDGRNQPRLINIAGDSVLGRDPSYFDFVNDLALNETVTVKKILGASGMFAPGVIQYALTYYNKNGQETNIFYTTPLNYISNFDRGVSPEGKVENAFKVSIKGVDGRFDYLRIYSIQRTSINGTPICKRIQDIAVRGLEATETVSYTDAGLSGDSIDPTELLYKGGEAIIASTLEQKDNTLFLGNIGLITKHKIEDISQTETKNGWVVEDSIRSFKATRVSEGIYDYSNQLTSYDDNNVSVPCAGFKRGDEYRCGVQFQHKTGKWSDPIWIADVTVHNKPEVSSSDTSKITVPTLKGTISNSTDIQNLYTSGYRRARAVVVFPNMMDRSVVCQGVANPTMYTDNHRGSTSVLGDYDKDIFAQSSWFFRPKIGANISDIVNGAVFPTDTGTLNYANREISGENSYNPEDNKTAIRKVEIQGDFEDKNKFKIDNTEVLTLHSPELEFDDNMQVMDYTGVGFRKVGDVEFTGTMSDINIQTETPVISNSGTGFTHKSFTDTNNRGIVSGLFYEDWIVDDAGDGNTFQRFERYNKDKENSPVRWMVYLWNKNGSLNNDITRPSDQGVSSAVLKKKVISNLRYSKTTLDDIPLTLSNFDFDPQLFNSDEDTVIKVGGAIYKGNVDTMLVPDRADGMYFAYDELLWDLKKQGIDTSFISNNWGKLFSEDPENSSDKFGIYNRIPLWNISVQRSWNHYSAGYGEHQVGRYYLSLVSKKDPVRMKYKSTSHLVLRQQANTFSSNIWNEMKLPVLEIIRKDTNHFGGRTADAFKENTWIPCGEPVPFKENDTSITFHYSYGDTYYQRYDCLKTYAFTPEDTNQVVEIGSFMLETHVNIDGRYDRNRGQLSNLNMSPRNFNLINPVYSQTDNFFTYKILPEDAYKDKTYPNMVTWSKTKENGADVDLWTNVTLSSVLELDGDKGELNELIRFNDQLIAFQDTGISQILYNENVQIQSTDGVPIEIANSGKVQGKRYLSNTVGCSNKWSMIQTPLGIYFMDNNEKAIYLFNGQLNNVSVAQGFNSWSKKSIPSANTGWNPTFPLVSLKSDFTAFYDRLNQDVLFVNKDTALAFSEKFGTFTSFYDYGDTPFFENLDDTGVWIRRDGKLWMHRGGNDYCKFFGENKPYSMILVGNPEPQQDCVFTNLEFRSAVKGDGTVGGKVPVVDVFDATFDFTFHPEEGATTGGRFEPYLPFDYLETWNEYQHGKADLSYKNGSASMRHNLKDRTAHLDLKFRMWRCDIPRDNYPMSGDMEINEELGITRLAKHPNDRMRNPWIYLKLMKNKELDNNKALPKAEIHDFIMTYYI